MNEIPVLTRVSDYVDHYARITPDADAAMSSVRAWSYRQLRAEVDQAAALLLAKGVRPGDRVAVLAPPSLDFLVSFLATVSIGGIWLGLQPKQTLREYLHVLRDAEPRLLLARSRYEARAFDDLFAEALTALPDLDIVRLDGDDGELTRRLGEGTLRPTGITLAEARAATDADDAALLVYTSGTTGAPKGALLSHRALVHCCRTIGRYDRFAAGMRVLNNLPINHIASVGDITATAIVNGGAVLFMESFLPAAIPGAIEQHRLTHWGQIPAMFMLTLAEPSFANADLSSLRRITWGGNAAPLSLVAALRAICADLGNVYGSTETTGNILCLFGSEYDGESFSTTVGPVVPEYEITLRDDAGLVVAPEEVGEIWTRGPHTMIGYWRQPEATAAVFAEGSWLKTGDLARLRSDGLVELVGRKREMFKSGGYNVYPVEIEQVLEADPLVAMAVVVPVPHPLYAEVGHAFLLPTDGEELDMAAVRTRAEHQLAAYKLPKRFHPLSEPPLLPNGKIDRIGLRARAVVLSKEDIRA